MNLELARYWISAGSAPTALSNLHQGKLLSGLAARVDKPPLRPARLHHPRAAQQQQHCSSIGRLSWLEASIGPERASVGLQRKLQQSLDRLQARRF